MERRRAVIAAATASLTLLAGAAAVSINSGIVGAGNDDVGQIQQVDATTPDSVTVDAPDGSAGRERARDSSAPATTSSPRADDRDHDDEEHLDDDRSGATGDHAYEVEHEYEGADDDD